MPRLHNAGVLVGLGADGPPCNNRMSVFHEMSLAATLHSLRHGPGAVSAWQALRMATADGARALGLDHEIGTLEEGKAADVVVVEMDDWSQLPAGDPASRLVYGSHVGHVRHVIVDGHAVVLDHEPVGQHVVHDLRRKCRDAWQATAARMEEIS